MSVLRVPLDDVTLECQVMGDEQGPLAICLHGFPDTFHTYRYLAPHLVERGYRVVVPSMRGYAPSTPSSTDCYHLSALALDAINLHDYFSGDERSILVGHDWGAATTYLATAAEPERWHRAITMSIPPLVVFASAMSRFPQLAASWYMTFFQEPHAEQTVAAENFNFLDQLCARWSPHYDATEDLAWVKQSLKEPAHLSAALGYYRALRRSLPGDNPRLTQINNATFNEPRVPTLYVQGLEDQCFLASGATNVIEHLAPGSRTCFVEGAGHFVHLEKPDVVNNAVDGFLQS